VFKLTLTTLAAPNGAAFHEKTAYICVYHQPLYRLTPFLLQGYLFVKGVHTT
jgi:hypothetical protein